MPMSQKTPTSPRLPTTTWRDWILLLLRQRKKIRVTGDSMQPTLHHGDIVLVDEKAYIKQTPAIGDIVIAKHPYQKNLKIIKRIADITPENRMLLHSDNPTMGTDSRQFGTISPNRILGQVTSYSPIIK